MAGPRRNRTTPRPRRRPSTEVSLATPEVDVNVAGRLTEEILELDRTGKRHVAHNVVAIGRRLLALQHHLGFGDWLRWLGQKLPYSPRTAQRYIALTQWATAFPEDFELFAHLGIGKIQQLALLTDRQRRKFRSGRRFQIPGGSTPKTLEVMTFADLAAIIAGPGGLQAAPASLPAGKVLQRFRHRVAGLDAMADQLRDRAEELDLENVRQAYDEMLAVAEEIEEAFGF